MQKLAIAIILVLSSLNLKAHGGHIAVFKYQVGPNSIELEFQIENSVLEHFDLEKQCKSYETATALCLFRYIKAKTFLKLNNDEIRFELEGSRQDEGFFSIKMRAEGNFLNCENIILDNKCFLEFDRSFENRIIIQRKGTVKSYLLNRKNTDLAIM